jgi:hypothetical protein
MLSGMVLAEGPHAHGKPSAAVKERGREGGESCFERGIEEGEGG